MDQQKLIAIVKDQLKGGVGPEQVRELLAYRGIAPTEIDAIMQQVLAHKDIQQAQMAETVVEKVGEAFVAAAQEAPVRSEHRRHEWLILTISIVVVLLLIGVGSYLYYHYF